MNKKQQFWQDLKAPPPEKRSCWNCQFAVILGMDGEEVAGSDGWPLLEACNIGKARLCKQNSFKYTEQSLQDSFWKLKDE